MTKFQLMSAFMNGTTIDRIESCGRVYTNVYISGITLESGGFPQHFNVNIYTLNNNGVPRSQTTIYVKTID